MSDSTIPQVIPIANKQIKDMTGLRFGRLTVIGYVGSRPIGAKRRLRATWLCRCDCDATVVKFGGDLRTGHVKSCGCVQSENAKSVGKDTQKHGKINTPEYFAWRSMRQRCENPNSHSYKNYGARGISVCYRWRESFNNFLEDMGPRPSPDHSLDRIDNDGNYAPDNCRWATPVVQMDNRRINRRITYNGVTRTVSEWARIVGVRRDTLSNRIYRLGWTVERALTTP